jgi:shikimate kinase
VNIALVGMPGSGKSTVGRQLARRLQLPFTDADHWVEQSIGCSIREFFEREGEARFREVEEAALDAITSSATGGVVATGGGAVLRPSNRACLHRNAHVFYLWSSPEEVFRRLRHDQNRPLLQVADPLATLRQMFAVRDPLYRETAHHVIETTRPSTSALVRIIIATLEQSGALPPRPPEPPAG